MKVIDNNQRLFSFFYLSSLIFLSLISPSSCAFIVSNNCPYTIWPATLAGAGTPALPTTGFRLDSGQALKIQSTPGWSGRIWARTGCAFNENTGVGPCQTGDCGGRLECDGMGASPPASLFEITLGVGDQKDFYDVSIVDGYNLPLIAAPVGVFGGGCNATGCVSDINMGCPRELQVVDGSESGGEVVGCKSACEAFGLDQYCCSGVFANPTTCRPSIYSSIFKMACPRAYSYAFDDGTSTFTCKAYDYAIIFCPTYSSGNSSSGSNGTRRSGGSGGGGGGGESAEPVIQDISRSKLEGRGSKTVSSSGFVLAVSKLLLINFIFLFISSILSL